MIVSTLYLVAIFADFIAPYDYREQTRSEPTAPPSTIRWRDADGNLYIRPFIYEQKLADARTMRYEEDTTQRHHVTFFPSGHTYSLFGLFPTNLHFCGIDQSRGTTARLRLLGTDQLGRDRFSRLLLATRFSLLVSPLGTILACLVGIAFGAISGYASQTVDSIMMGVADTMISLPTLILILAARTAFPLVLPPSSAAILLVSIFAMTGWAGMARLTRGLVQQTRQLEFVLAARSIGLRESTILWKHVLPNISSPLVIQATLMLPVFLLAEVTLSFLGVGLQEPEPSIGNMLSAALDLSQLRESPFVILAPALVIFLFVLGVRLATHKQSEGTKSR